MQYCDLVNIRQGTASVHRFSTGNTLPLTQLPFGMASFAPQTCEDKRWYYHPSHRSLEGVRLTHQPSPWIADYGAFVFLPQRGTPACGGEERWSGFRPEEATLTPYLLQLELLRARAVFALSPTERGAVGTVTFTDDAPRYLSVLPVKDHYAYRFDPATQTLFASTDMNFGGDCKNFRAYLALRFDGDAVDADGTLCGQERDNAEDLPTSGLAAEGEMTSIHLRLRESETTFRLAVSYISFAQALCTLEAETAGLTPEAACEAARARWESYLSRVQIEAADDRQLRTFYSCLYRAFLYPHKCYEYDAAGAPVHYCPHDGSVRPGVRYTDNGFWDTYRTVYPFFSLVAREELKEMLCAFINEYEESGWLPRWLSIGERGCMPSTLIDAVICDGAVKGLIDPPTLRRALAGMLKHATTDPPHPDFGRNGAADYCRLGYVPYENQNNSVNLTLDAAYGDWCIAEIAKLLGETAIEAAYRKRAKNYRNLFDPSTGFMRAKDRSGRFRPDFSPVGWGRDYTEGSAWQNSFAVPHDVEGLAALYGGKDAFLQKIDALFATPPIYEIVGYDCEIHEITEMAAADFGQCAISNQPSFHLPYLYAALGEVEKTAYWVERICKEAFSDAADGFPGDEDNGSMALWYVFGVLGFYPFCPGKPEFVKGKKQVRAASILGKPVDADAFPGSTIPYDALI